MSAFSLLPVAGGDPIRLQPGETLLGRGPLLGITDKRVSRHHGLLQNQNGRLLLKPTSLNPCFVQSSLSDDPRVLQKGNCHRLHPGEFFSLLPGQFVFKVVNVGEEDATLRNSDLEDLQESPEPDVEPDVRQEATLAAPTNEEDEVEEEEEEVEVEEEEEEVEVAEKEAESLKQGGVARPAARRRVLPAWMTAAVAPTASHTAVKRNIKPAARQATPTTPCSPEGAGLSGEEEEEMKKKEKKKRRRKVNDEEEAPSKTVPKVVDQNQNQNQNQNQTKTRRRTPCPYGKDCYRKNPLHFQDSSHPGDADYEEEEEEEEEESERPECPYGTDCYRKNPLHRKEFKHTRRPARSTRTVVHKSPDDEDEDEDDGFIVDDSEDAGDDSDYRPLESGSSEDEAREEQALLGGRK